MNLSSKDRLIRTWDVFKLVGFPCMIIQVFRLIRTWDVFKLCSCVGFALLALRLIRTWDVFKQAMQHDMQHERW